MTKLEFMQQLQQGLSQLPQTEISERLGYYEEMLQDMMEDGMTEQEAVEKLGDPAVIARQILEEVPLTTLVKTRVRPRNGWSTAAIVLAILGAPLWVSLAIAAVSLVGSLYLTAWALVLSFYAVVLSLGLGGFAVIVGSVSRFGSGLAGALLGLGGGLTAVALGCLGVCAAYYLTLGIWKGTRWTYLKIKTLFMK